VNSPIQFKTTTPIIFIAPLALLWLALSQTAPAGPDDEYPNANTAEGLFALFTIVSNSANTGGDNTAMG
jgi:hypothetical protein